ncbi:uncharacterized protein BCR38DRAFT_516239 [Pseudomassariella vexata]|uniref:NAD-dependent epimerase/dehydratase domain-containing protein n=1 Tax=Pseudomassariella vexata TaxID=1141098 RepID=A0A1Y2DV85_9PEZI|nr:uncharacterized protein BCR38DRAFT_516239 [Pseudomassariella vexata]ORY63202.1 hypothetical protein BCR38DRAFT_516239 [Pseudomassariella vexata]
MPSLEEPALHEGSTVLVTGANGFLGSHIADQFLHYGFKVRGTVRDVNKNVWLADIFREKYGEGRFELWEIPDMAAQGFLDEAVKGVSAVTHTASIMSLDHDPNKVIPGAIAFGLNALKAIYAEPSVKRFETWNEDAVQKAWADPPYTPERSHAVYSASKTLTEQAIWKYHKQHFNERPELLLVLPNMTLGKSLDPVKQAYPSTAGMVALLYRGEVVEYHRIVPRQYFVDVQDVGRLHVAAAVLDKVRGQRIFGFAARYSWDSVLGILRKLEPAKVFVENFSGGEDPNEIEPRHKAEQLLRDLGRPGWTSLEESVWNMVEGFLFSRSLHDITASCIITLVDAVLRNSVPHKLIPIRIHVWFSHLTL